MTPIDQLLAIASPPLGGAVPAGMPALLDGSGAPGAGLAELLRRRNGFYAFESALWVLPCGESSAATDLVSWNDPAAWRAEYGDLLRGEMLFFAFDALGDQFGLAHDGVFRMTAETGECKLLAATIEDWAGLLLREWRELTAFPLAHEWQIENGPLPAAKRLIPYVPFVLGGAFKLTNLYCGDLLDATRFRGSLARQIRDVPDGTPVELIITPTKSDSMQRHGRGSAGRPNDSMR